MGFSKGTLHYMKKNAEADKPFILNAHGRERLDLWGEDADIEELQRKYLYAYSTSKP